jgi:hypothetical protein
MGSSPNGSLQYGFLLDPEIEGEEEIEKISKLFENKKVDTTKVDLEYYGTDGYTGICVYAVGSSARCYYAEEDIDLTKLSSMEGEFKKTMEDFCKEHELTHPLSWCLCANYT